ncbi:sigma-70 family RNA polymerase sigma factor [candidate division KSB1 bacterium]|nr:sigma-70 family RNA polymerase sigma factor [candidate division KSB1 bacterium]
MADQSKELIPDNKLVKRVLKGDGRAFEMLIKKYQKRLYFTIRKMLGSHDDTDDVLQETFIKAYNRLDSYKETYPFYPWLHRIAINTAINFSRKNSTRKESSLDGMLEEGNPGPGYHRNPHHELERIELTEHVKIAIENLPIDQKAVFLLRTSDGLSYEEISEQLNISMGTVMSRLSRARDKLRKQLRGYL